ncbi:MAG TPA: VOC family protein [Steroidobacteraceae bacterium]|nr:VOC family protein [Steroidobacteraceae bacterium]
MKISTCFWFDTQAEEAARFYVSLFADARVTEISRYGPGQPMPDGLALAVNLEIEGARFMLLNGGPVFRQSEAASICVSCDTQAEIDRLWSALTAGGGKESMCGWLKDRYGVSWQITPAILGPLMSGDPARAARVMGAFMQMRKFDIAALQAAARG